MRTCIVIAYGLNALVGSRVGRHMVLKIRNGHMTLDLVRPLNDRTTQIATAAGMSVVEGLVALVLVPVLGTLVFDVQPPASP